MKVWCVGMQASRLVNSGVVCGTEASKHSYILQNDAMISRSALPSGTYAVFWDWGLSMSWRVGAEANIGALADCALSHPSHVCTYASDQVFSAQSRRIALPDVARSRIGGRYYLRYGLRLKGLAEPRNTTATNRSKT